MTSFSGQGGVAMVTKLNASGSSLVFSTFLGGNMGTDQISALALDAAGNIVAAGPTNSTDFPVAAPAVQSALGSAGTELDAFVATLSSDGSAVLRSTYLGGASHDFALDVAVDVTGALAVSGATASANVPVANAVQGALAGDLDMFVTKISGDGTSLAFSSYVGGTAKDGVLENSCCLHGVAIDRAGAVVMAGNTFSTDLVTVNAYQSSNRGSADVFVIKLVDVVTVAIDVKPGSHPNSINLGANGTVPVAILSSATFDATSVDPLTVTLASAPVRLKGKGTPMASATDVNGDGRLDLVAHVSTEALQLSQSDTLAVLEGRTSSGLTIRGSDSIRVVY